MINQPTRSGHSPPPRPAAVCLLLVFGLLAAPASQAGLPRAEPAAVGMRGERLDFIDRVVQEGLEQGRMPGCVVTIGRRGKIVFHRAYGFRQLRPTKLPMTTDAVFDMASITKPVATATSIMVLLEQGRIRLGNKVGRYIPEFANGGKEDVTVYQLLTHQAGFIPDNAVADYEQGRESAFERIYQLETTYPPGSKFVYSDVGFVLLDDLIERISGQRVDAFSRANIFQPLGMRETGFLPAAELRARAATTEQREGRWMQGEVHDPRAYLLGGVAGHAGLFSTAEDLAVYAQMMLNGGYYQHARILSEATVDLMTRAAPIIETNRTTLRGLGWDKLSGYSSNRGENFSASAFGHGGFTGTVLWIDPELDLFFIFLSNRVHPDGQGVVNRLAGRVGSIAAGAIDDDLLSDRAAVDEPPRVVKTGMDVLQADGFTLLRGQRVGLITNQTGVNTAGVSTIQLLRQSPQVDLRVLFSPEHGLAGTLEQPEIGDAVDAGSGLQVFSLYGESRAPSAAQLAGVDTLVFDVQDVGCRFYTYISTLGLAMEAAARHGKRFIVLDRPNPINGVDMGGPMLDAGRESFVGFHALPVRHGMTVGELARMFQQERELDLQLDVVPVEGWRRAQYWDHTGLWWINPSPNMRNLNQAILYPGVGLLETTNLSVGRGTDTPFELVGAPWLRGREFADALNRAGISGVRFTPRQFTPSSSKFAGQLCEGVQISITNRADLRPLRLGLELAVALRAAYRDQWQSGKMMRLLASQETLDAIEQGNTADEILALIQPQVADFQVRRRPFLLYED